MENARLSRDIVRLNEPERSVWVIYCICTYKYDHNDKGGQVGGPGHPHADKAVMLTGDHVPQESCREPHKHLSCVT